MVGKNNQRLQAERQGDKHLHYSIKKLKVGVASVAVAASIFMTGGAVGVSAETITEASGQPTEATRASLDENQHGDTHTAENAETAAPETSERPTVSETPETSEQPTVSETPETSEQPTVSETSETSEHPTVSETSETNEQPTVSEASETNDQPTISEAPETSEQPVAPGGPNDTLEDDGANERLTRDEYNALDVPNLANQVVWLDFTDRTKVSNFEERDGHIVLRVGTTYEKEIASGYIVRAEVTALRPFHASDVFRDSVAGTDKQHLYNADQGNYHSKNPEEARTVIVGKQNARYSHLKKAGLNTGNRLTNFTTAKDSGVFGVEFQLSATYNGRPVSVDLVMSEAEEANGDEATIFTTDGANWELVSELAQPNNDKQYVPITARGITGTLGSAELAEAYVNAAPNGGLGTKVFGPVLTSLQRGAVPIVMTRGANKVGAYIASHGKQSFQMGFLVKDSSDAPSPYGKADHLINKVSPTGETIKQPYLGMVPADVDFEKDRDTNPTTAWTNDDRLQDADEGETQLSDAYPVFHTTATSYSIDVKADTNGYERAYVAGWIDFNSNGRFEESERAVVTATGKGVVTLHFDNIPQITETTVRHLGARVRIALNEADVRRPTGVAMSGEVEDFLIPVVTPPRGSVLTVSGTQGVPVSGQVTFNAYGLVNGQGPENMMDATQAAAIVTPEGRLVSEYHVANEGVYTVTQDGTVTFRPNTDFLGEAKGVAVRRWDYNNLHTGWTHAQADQNTNRGVNQTNTMDGVFLPTINQAVPIGQNVTSQDVQGVAQAGKPQFTTGNEVILMVTHTTKFVVNNVPVDATEIIATSGDQEAGVFQLNRSTGAITFKPHKQFHGTVDPATVQQADQNGVVATATYQPTVVPVVPSATGVQTQGIQGQEQSGRVTFASGDPKVSMIVGANNLVSFIVNDQESDAEEIDATANGAVIGRYRLDRQTGVVTFVPRKSFTGMADPATVSARDANGTAARAQYTPEVLPVRPVGHDVTSRNNQGAVQTATPIFEAGDVRIPISITAEEPAIFVSETGEVLGHQVAATFNGQSVGTFELDPFTAEVTFTPNSQFVGTPDAVLVQVRDANGTPVTARYIPTVLSVTPEGLNVTSQGLQGKQQTGQPKFVAADVRVPIAPSSTTPARFYVANQPLEETTTPAYKGSEQIGTFAIEPETGMITFTPMPQFHGEVTPITVVVTDQNGTPAYATYQPIVKAVTPTATSARSEGLQGKTQTGQPSFMSGDSSIEMQPGMRFVDGTQVTDAQTVPALKEGIPVGSYTLDQATNRIVFTPNHDFVGTPDAVWVEAMDANGTPVRASYTPTVKKVTPTGQSVMSKGPQGLPQTGQPLFKEGVGDAIITPSTDRPAQLVRDGQAVSERSVPATANGRIVGAYTIEPATGVVTFTPHADFVGMVDPITVAVRDANGTVARATYTPQVEAVKPRGVNSTSTGQQGATQQGTPQFEAGHPEVPLVISATNPVRFVVENQLSEQHTVPAIYQGTTVGTYTLDPLTGTITFMPHATFSGTPDSAVVATRDQNGTMVMARYTPMVTSLPNNPSVAQTGPQGTPISETPRFVEPGTNVPIVINNSNPARLVVNGTPISAHSTPALKEGKKVGTYTIDPTTGTVTFTPDKSFVGSPDPIEVAVNDATGTPIRVQFVPTVTPVVPSATDHRSVGVRGATQMGRVPFVSGDSRIPLAKESLTLLDAEGMPTKEVVLAGVGTYQLLESGAIAFTPDPSFVGTATPVRVQMTDANGVSATASYHAVVVATDGVTVAQHTPISVSDITSKLNLPPGSEIVSVGTLPSTNTPGEQPTTPVVVRIPGQNGNPDLLVTIDVPTNVLPMTDKVSAAPVTVTPIGTHSGDAVTPTVASPTLPNTGTASSLVSLALATACVFSGFLFCTIGKKGDTEPAIQS